MREDRPEALVALEQQRQRRCARTRSCGASRSASSRAGTARSRARSRLTSCAIRTSGLDETGGGGRSGMRRKVTLASCFQRSARASSKRASRSGVREARVLDRGSVAGPTRSRWAPSGRGRRSARRRCGPAPCARPSRTTRSGCCGGRVGDHVDRVEQRDVVAVAARDRGRPRRRGCGTGRCRRRRRACRRPVSTSPLGPGWTSLGDSAHRSSLPSPP